MWAMDTKRTKQLGCGAFVLFALTGAGVANGVTVTVCQTGCDSTTIQGAVTMADPGDTIQILSSGDHTEADIWISKDITISGFGPQVTVIQADPVMATATLPVFVVVSGATVTMESLKIRHGGGGSGGGVNIIDGRLILDDVIAEYNHVSGAGGAVYVSQDSSLQIIDSWILNNVAGKGGGIYNLLGSVEITGSMVKDNSAEGVPSGTTAGGGIYNGGDLTIRSSSVSQNDVDGGIHQALGGGIYHSGASIVIEGTNVWTNRIDGGFPNQGGGLFAEGSGVVELRGTSVRNNEADSGAGIYHSGGDLSLEDCFIEINSAESSGGGITLDHFGSDLVIIAHSTVEGNDALIGGGIKVSGNGPTRIFNSTISGNSATDDAGGLSLGFGNDVSIASTTITNNTADSDADGYGNGGGIVIAAGADVDMRNTILAENHDDSQFPSPMAFDCVGTIQSFGHNLIRSMGFPIPSCTIAGDTTGNITGTDPMLLALANNGGPTLTHALDAGSPAIDAGDPAGCTDPLGAPLPTDQRHGVRQDRCDMGAYEVSATFGVIFADGFESGGTGAWSFVSGG